MGLDRPSFQQIYLSLAQMLAARSTCRFRTVGTVIVSPDFRKVIAVGYGGNATGLPNRCDRDDRDDCGCLHSEENAVINCDAPRESPKIVFVTDLPCTACAKRLINLGNIQDLYYAVRVQEASSKHPTTPETVESAAMLAGAGIRLHPLDPLPAVWPLAGPTS